MKYSYEQRLVIVQPIKQIEDIAENYSVHIVDSVVESLELTEFIYP